LILVDDLSAHRTPPASATRIVGDRIGGEV
jgi:hypothetical protein